MFLQWKRVFFLFFVFFPLKEGTGVSGEEKNEDSLREG